MDLYLAAAVVVVVVDAVDLEVASVTAIAFAAVVAAGSRVEFSAGRLEGSVSLVVSPAEVDLA